MTNVPEAFLAREAQLAYCTICLVTDYDCWMDDPARHVNVDAFMATYQEAIEKATAIVAELLQQPLIDAAGYSSGAGWVCAHARCRVEC